MGGRGDEEVIFIGVGQLLFNQVGGQSLALLFRLKCSLVLVELVAQRFQKEHDVRYINKKRVLAEAT